MTMLGLRYSATSFLGRKREKREMYTRVYEVVIDDVKNVH
jgi:hypothetical protein